MMSTLPALNRGASVVVAERATASHDVRVTISYWTPDSPRYVLGWISVNLHDARSMDRLRRLKAYLGWKFHNANVDYYQEERGAHIEQRRLTDLERFKRKMGQVLRAYEQEKKVITAHGMGLFVTEELLRLDRQLEEAWAKAERIYRCNREDYYRSTTPHHATQRR